MNFELFRNKIISKMLSKVSTRANWKPQNTPSRVYHISCLSLLFLSVGDITPCLRPTWPGHSEIKAWRGGCCGVSPFGIPFLFAVNLMISPSEIIHQQLYTDWLTGVAFSGYQPAVDGFTRFYLFPIVIEFECRPNDIDFESSALNYWPLTPPCHSTIEYQSICSLQ